MPRPKRIHVPGALYYVTCKALEGLLLFREEKDYGVYLQFLEEARLNTHFKLFAYVLLADRMHLCLELTGETTISEIMHALNSRYTKYYNKQHGHSGHLLQERFKSTLMEKASSLLPITGFIHRLPAESGTSADYSAYRWSSYSKYLASDSQTFGGEVKEVLAALSQIQQDDYQAYVNSLSKTQLNEIELQTHQWLAGSESFKVFVESQSAASAKGDEKSKPSAPVLPSASLPAAPIFNTSIAIAILAIFAAAFYAKNFSTLQQTVQALSRERSLVFVETPQEPQAAMTSISNAHLSVFPRPSRLAGTSWDVQVVRMDSAGSKAVASDELTFSTGKVASSTLLNQGFEPSNYSLSLQPDGKVLWETMQTGRAGEVVCWRGEWDGHQMRGVMTRQLPGEPLMNFSFVGVAKPVQEAAQHNTRET